MKRLLVVLVAVALIAVSALTEPRKAKAAPDPACVEACWGYAFLRVQHCGYFPGDAGCPTDLYNAHYDCLVLNNGCNLEAAAW